MYSSKERVSECNFLVSVKLGHKVWSDLHQSHAYKQTPHSPWQKCFSSAVAVERAVHQHMAEQKFLLDIMQVESTAIGRVCFRLLLPEVVQPVFNQHCDVCNKWLINDDQFIYLFKTKKLLKVLLPLYFFSCVNSKNQTEFTIMRQWLWQPKSTYGIIGNPDLICYVPQLSVLAGLLLMKSGCGFHCIKKGMLSLKVTVKLV